MLYEVAILEHPTEKSQKEGGAQAKIVLFERVIANDDQSAAINAVLSGALPQEVDRSRLEVLVRPFA